MRETRISARGGWLLCAVALTLAWGLPAVADVTAVTAFAPYSLGALSLQNGWDGGAGGGPFTNDNAGSDVITNLDAHTGTQCWLLGGSYNSPGAGTPFTPDVATVGALNATAAGSPITPAGNKSVVSFAFRAVVPAGDGSRINVYEGSWARDDRTGGSLYLRNDTVNGNPAGTVSLYNYSSTNNPPDPPGCDTPLVILGSVAAGTWHTVEMTTTYPNLTVGDPTTYGSTTYVFDKGMPGQQTATMQSWAHPWRNCEGFNYAPGGSLKWVNSDNDWPTHQGFYIDDVSMKVVNTGTGTTVGLFATSFEGAALTQAALTVNVTSPAANGTTQTLTTSGGSGGGAVSYSVGASSACSVLGDQLTITSGSGTCVVTATKAADDVYSSITSAPATVALQDSSVPAASGWALMALVGLLALLGAMKIRA